MPSFIFCLRQLTALTHLMGQRFSFTSARSAQRGILLCDQYEISYNLFSILFLGATFQGLSTSSEISFCNPLPSSIPVNTFLFSHILPMHSFLLPFILRLLYFIHFGSTDSEMLTTLLSPTFLSNTSSLFLTYQLKLFSSLLTQPSQLIRSLPPFLLGTYILATSLQGCSSLFMVMISSTSFIVCPFINLIPSILHNFPHFSTTIIIDIV